MEDSNFSKIETGPFGDIKTVEQLINSVSFILTYYREMIDQLVDLGYTRNVDVKGAPYDFRKLPSKA